jgi:hypothetical protein
MIPVPGNLQSCGAGERCVCQHRWIPATHESVFADKADDSLLHCS